MEVFKSNAAKLLCENWSFFIAGVTQKPNIEDVKDVARKVVDNPAVYEQRTATQEGRYLVFSDESKLDLGAKGIKCSTFDLDDHTILEIHKSEVDSFDGSTLHKYLYYLIL